MDDLIGITATVSHSWRDENPSASCTHYYLILVVLVQFVFGRISLFCFGLFLEGFPYGSSTFAHLRGGSVLGRKLH
jgi:hypothetical protein